MSAAFGTPVNITDGVLLAIGERLASVPPERGGALLAVGGLIHLLAEDTHGAYSAASWDISHELGEAVARLEAAGHGVLAGTVHSHPAGTPDPSVTDIATTTRALGLNPHLDGLLIAIVTAGLPRPGDVPIAATHRMSLHRVIRRGHDSHELTRVQARIVPLASDLATADLKLPSMTSSSAWLSAGPRPALPTVQRVNDQPRLAIAVSGGRASVLIDPGYPVVGPLVLASPRSREDKPGQVVGLPSPWDPLAAPAPQLAALARSAGTERIPDATQRIGTLVGQLAARHVLLAGAGSVGSRIAEDLVRSGVGRLSVIDPETVEAVNLSRTVYVAPDLGADKPEALRRRLRAIDPAVTVDCHSRALGELDLSPLLAGVDLVIAATDDLPEQALLAHHAYTAGIPLVACALYKAAAAGEVVLAVPAAHTACWSCSLGALTHAPRPEQDYGLGGRLAGEAALGPAIHLVTNVATMAALGLLAGPDTPAGQPLSRLLAEHRTLGVIATQPEWEFFPELFAGMRHQHAPQSLWAKVEPAPDCPVCGLHRTPPLSAAHGDALIQLRAELQKQLHNGQPERPTAAAANGVATPTVSNESTDGLPLRPAPGSPEE